MNTWFSFHGRRLSFYELDLCLCLSLGQIVADIYEAQGLAFVEASATFLTNELLPLVKKTVTDTRVRVRNRCLVPFWLKTVPNSPQSTCLSGTHIFLTNVGAAEEMSRM